MCDFCKWYVFSCSFYFGWHLYFFFLLNLRHFRTCSKVIDTSDEMRYPCFVLDVKGEKHFFFLSLSMILPMDFSSVPFASLREFPSAFRWAWFLSIIYVYKIFTSWGCQMSFLHLVKGFLCFCPASVIVIAFQMISHIQIDCLVLMYYLIIIIICNL